MQFSDLMKVEPSATVAINSLALQKKLNGERVYNLSAGEPMVKMDNTIALAAKKAIATGKTHYPPVAGIPELKTAAAEWLKENFQADYSTSECLVTCGGKYGVFSLCEALLNPGDEALIISPYWVSYPGMVKLFGGVPKIIETTSTNGWQVTASQIAQAISPKTKILIINSASNPTGVVYGKEELKKILAVAKARNIFVICDEVYSGLIYDGKFTSAAEFKEFKDNVAIVQSCSKHFAMTGWRVGLVFAPVEVIKILSMLQGQSTTGTASISQWAAVAAFKAGRRISKEVNKAMKKRRDVFVNTFNKLFNQSIQTPASGLYVLAPMSAIGTRETDSGKFCKEVMEKANVAIVPGSAFGAEGYVRFAFGETEKELVAGLNALAKFLK